MHTCMCVCIYIYIHVSLCSADIMCKCNFLQALNGSKATAGERNPADQLHSAKLMSV